MIIVLFHVLYLLGKVVYYQCKSIDKKRNNVPEEMEEKSEEPSLHELNFTEDFNDKWSNAMSETVVLKRRYSDSDDDPEESSKSVIKFYPPVFIQRYQAVLDVLAKYHGKLKKVVEFGCAELALCVYLKKLEGVEEVLFVDVDRVTLESSKMRAKPLHVDYLHRRNRPLVIRILEGSITQPDQSLENCDAVICIELVEHLYPEPLTTFPFNVFGFIKPQVAIITTPNSEFNVLFTNLKGFRHPDHKFEWTRSQFEDWALNITSRFPEYEVSFHGICNGPEGTEHLGACSQMAVFHKKFDLVQEKVRSIPGLYQTVEVYEFPYEIDNRSDEQKILDDALYYIRKYSYNEYGEFIEEISLQRIISVMSKPFVLIEELKEILINAGWNIIEKEEGPVVVVPPPSETFSDSHSIIEDEFFDDDNNIYQDEEYWGPDPGPPNDYFIQNQNINTWEDEVWDDDEPVIINPVETVRDHSTINGNNLTQEVETANGIVNQDQNTWDVETLGEKEWDNDSLKISPVETFRDNSSINNINITKEVQTTNSTGIQNKSTQGVKEVRDNDQVIINPVETSRDHRSMNNLSPEIETASSTISILSDECFDDLTIEDRSTELANSEINEPITFSSFSDVSLATKESENSENALKSLSELTSSVSINEIEATDLFSSLTQAETIASVSAINGAVNKSTFQNDSMCSMYLESSNLSTDEYSEDLVYVTPNSTFTSPENNIQGRKLKLSNINHVNDKKEHSFEEPNFTSSPLVLSSLSCNKKQKDKTRN